MRDPYRNPPAPTELTALRRTTADLPEDDTPIVTVDLRGRDGSSGRSGSSGSSGSDGSYNSDGSRGAGGNGGDGSPGGHGSDGTDASSHQFSLRMSDGRVMLDGKVVAGRVAIDARGGDGGSGGNGGSGGSGGNGSPSGSSGSDGRGGDGGNGGDGGHIVVETEDAHLLGLLDDVRVAAGHGGSGGSGSPRGRAGARGRDGSVRFLCRTDDRVEEDTCFGLVPTGAVSIDDGTRIGEFVTRGSLVEFTAVSIENPTNITVPAPFLVELAVVPPISATAARSEHRGAAIWAKRTLSIECQLEAKVADDADLGTYALRIDLRSQRGDLRPHLTASRADGVLELTVNHRLVEGEIPTKGENARQALQALCAELNGKHPAAQAAFFTAGLLATVSPETVLTAETRASLGPALEGRLLDPDQVFRQLDAMERRRFPAVVREASLHFFAALPMDARKKVMDAVFYYAGSDDLLVVAEKRRLMRVAERLQLGPEWLSEHMPRVLESGDTRIEPTVSNRLGLAALALATIPACAIVRAALLRGGTADSLTGPQQAFTRLGSVFDLVVCLGAAALFFQPLRHILLRCACAACGSLKVRAIEPDSPTVTTIGSADAYRCVDCGARGHRDEGDDGALQSADCALGDEPPWVRVGTVFVLLSALGAAAVVETAPAFRRIDLAHGLVVLGVAAMVWLHARKARHVRTWQPLLLAGAMAATIALVSS